MTRTYSILLGAICITAWAAAAPADNAPVRTTAFPDVPKNHWAYDAVESLRQKGIIRGYPFEPSRKDDPKKPHKAPPHSQKRRRA